MDIISAEISGMVKEVKRNKGETVEAEGAR